MNLAAIYARVSSDRQKENQTIESQVSALKEFALAKGYTVPEEWCFKDDGYSGTHLIRPALERLRDLTAEGQIATVLIHSPDRLSRKYAYQVLLMEEFSRSGAQVIFLKSPQATTPEEHLLLQFQGMISEYERAQIAERSRRGKKYRARLGAVNVLSHAPYGYRYIKKTETSNASYVIVDEQAEIVRRIFHEYIQIGRPLIAIVGSLQKEKIPTHKGKGNWFASVVRGVLRNPAYKGQAAFGRRAVKTEITGVRGRFRGQPGKGLQYYERPPEEWISIPVPPIISAETFDLAQERLRQNKHYALRNTKLRSILQGLLVCGECGYAVYRAPGPKTRAGGQKVHYYRCSRSMNRPRMCIVKSCSNPPIRQDYLDELVWNQVIQLLENPELIRAEIDRRVQQAQTSNPVRTRKDSVVQEQIRIQKGMDRLLDAYQEGLLPLVELRERIPDLRKRSAALKTELQSLEATFLDHERRSQLAASLEEILRRLRQSANSLEIADRQKIVRLVVKEVLVDTEAVIIKHSIPIIQNAPNTNGPTGPNYQLRTYRANGCAWTWALSVMMFWTLSKDSIGNSAWRMPLPSFSILTASISKYSSSSLLP